MDAAAFLEDNWLSVVVAGYLIGMTLYGHYRGFLKLVISMTALIISLIAVRILMPQVTDFLRDNTGIHQWMEENMLNAVGLETGGQEISQALLPAEQRSVIEGISLPESLKEALIENNNEEIYQMLGVDQFVDYIGSFLADRIINTLAFILLFLLVYVAVRVLAHLLDLVAKLPVLSGINQIAGAVLGLCLGLFYFWIFCLVLNLFVSTQWGQYLINDIENTPWISFLYRNNLLSGLLISVIWNLL